MNKKYQYIIGKSYGVLVLEETFRNPKSNRLMAKTRCKKCDKTKVINASDLYNERFISCACTSKKHGMSNTKIYSIYNNMKDRCLNKNNHAFKDYGGKGVKIHKEWLNDFITFYEWSINNGYKEGLTIDRIDHKGNYEPINCRWITLSENVSLANKVNARRKADKGRYFGIDPNKKYYEFENANEFAREHALNGSNIRDVANKRKKTHKGWIFGFVNENN